MRNNNHTSTDIVKLSKLNYFYFDDCSQIYTEGSLYTIYLFHHYADGNFPSSIPYEICRQVSRERTRYLVINEVSCVQPFMDACTRNTDGYSGCNFNGIWKFFTE